KDIAGEFFDVPKPMPPIYRKGGVQGVNESNYGPEVFEHAPKLWTRLLDPHNDSNEPFKCWQDDDGWHGEINSFGFVVRVTCRYENGQSHMVSLWTTGDNPQLIIQDEPEEEIE
ncbi:uncharacterized protein METZ01_LOCUS499863, partial [marine metagenome]